jgi:DNA-binding response OmpR family regulator
MKPVILMIDDDARLGSMVGEYLEQSGFSFAHTANGTQGLAYLADAAHAQANVTGRASDNASAYCSPALVLLDLMMPDMDGLAVCRRIRQMASPLKSTPILMLTAKGDPMDRVLGLELGADDYLPKPFEPRELLARIRAVLRRGAQESNAPSTGGDHRDVNQDAQNATLSFGSLSIDQEAREARVDGQICELTAYQFDLLLALAERAGRVLTREQIMTAVRGRELEAFDRSIDVHMGRIRQAIGDDAKNPRRILTVRGVGYVFAKQQH